MSSGPIQYDVELTRDGPYLATPDGPARPLARVVNAAADGLVVRAFAERIAAGLDADGPADYALRPRSGDDLGSERDAWRRLTGADPGEDVYVVGTRYERDRVLVPRPVLADLVDRLIVLRAEWRAGAVNLAELELQARALDELELEGTVESIARAAVKRWLLLEELGAAGLLASTATDVWSDRLGQEGCEYLLDYVCAGERLKEYLASAQRARLIADHGSAVSRDWFRLPPPIPVGTDPFAWTARWESVLAQTSTGDAPAGWFYVHDELGWHRVDWRREFGGPALLRVEPVL